MAGSVLCVLFTDLVGSTEIMSRLGDTAFDRLRSEHFAGLRAEISDFGGIEVKNTGDGLLATFTSATDALTAAARAQQVTDRQGREAGVTLTLRVGLALGEVTVDDGDVFGTPVVEAARLVAAARPGQILATALIRAVAGSRAGVTLTDAGVLELKGLPDPVAVCEVVWEPIPAATGAGLSLPGLLVGIGRIFVGRDSELERLRRLWKEASADGQKTLALLGGEPGIGKTRLAAELAHALHAEGALVLGGRCDEGMGVPYQPFVEALRHYVHHAPAPLRLGRHAGELARLVPELTELVPGLPEPLRSDPETERYRLFDALAAWLGDVSLEVSPVLLVLDDLHWAAKPTLLLLRHVRRASDPMRLLVLGTYRDTDVTSELPLAELLADLPRLGTAERLSLSGLGPTAVEDFVAAAAGHDLDAESEALARMVWRETDGNCFFVAEVLRHLAESRAIEVRDGRWVTTADIQTLGIPEGVRDVVRGRLNRLPDEANHVLSTAAVVGLEFDIRVVGAAGGFSEDELVDAVDTAVGARVLVEVPGVVPRNRFSHALVRATLYDGLSVARRRLLHRRVAEAIETQFNDLGGHFPALAHHWSESGADPDRAIDYATRAGDAALAQLAHDEAARFYAAALDLAAPDDPRVLELLISLGEARHRAGDLGHRDVLLRAARLAQERGDGNALARAALACTVPGFTISVGAVDAEVVAVLEDAVAAEIDSPGLRARVLAALALATVFAQDPARRLQLSDQALALARDSADPASLATVLANRSYSIMEPATLGQRLDDTAELVDLAARLGDPGMEFAAQWIRGRTLLETGDIVGSQLCAERSIELADDLGQPGLRWMGRFGALAPLLLAGRLAEADQMLHSAAELGRVNSQPGADVVAAFQRVVVWFELDRTAEAEPALARMAPAYPGVPGIPALVAWARCHSGQHKEASVALADLRQRSFELPADPTSYMLTAAAAEVVHQLADVEAASTLYEKLAPWPGVWANTGGVSLGVTAYYLGLLAITLDDMDLAERHLADAADRYETAGAPAHLGRTRIELGRLLARRGQIAAGRRVVEQALSDADHLRLPNVERRARELLESMGS